MADHGGNGGVGEVIDRPEDRGGPTEIQTEDQTAATVTEGQGAVEGGNGDGGEDREQEIVGGGDQRAPEAEPCATKESGAVGPSVEPLGSSTVARASPIVVGGSGDAGGNNSGSGETGPSGSPPRDPAKGKGAVTGEEETTGVPVTYREEDVLFWPAATSSSHWPITKHDVPST